MHSRIYSISTSQSSVRQFHVPEYFVPQYADYCLEADDQQDSVDWLTGTLMQYGVRFEQDGNRIIFHDVRPYLDAMYESFHKAAEKLCQITKEEFASEPADLYALNSANRDESGFWFLIEDEYPVTMQDFMRLIEPGKAYYLGTVYDYHF